MRCSRWQVVGAGAQQATVTGGEHFRLACLVNPMETHRYEKWFRILLWIQNRRSLDWLRSCAHFTRLNPARLSRGKALGNARLFSLAKYLGFLFLARGDLLNGADGRTLSVLPSSPCLPA